MSAARTPTPADTRTTAEVIAFVEQHARNGLGYTALWRGALDRLNSHDALVAALEDVKIMFEQDAMTHLPQYRTICAALKAAKVEA